MYQFRRHRGQGRHNSRFIPDAIIEEIAREQDTQFITIVYRMPQWAGTRRAQTLKMIVSKDTRILDEQGRRIRIWDLVEGMVVSARVSMASTKSIPPQAQAYEITVIERPARTQTTEGRILQVNVPYNYIITVDGNRFSSAIRFNITPDAQIVGPMGRSISIRELLPGMRVRVEHATNVTASIPPQAAAFAVQVIR